jgi:tRNA nucleotidyltransferase (CCA-adding enzyme)
MHEKINKTVWFIIETLKKNGFLAYIAGGAVRDILLHKKPDDFDILTNASPEQMSFFFKDQHFKIMGRAFPICMVNGIEVSTGRAKFDRANFPESDLAQRDFTINSMAWDPISKKIIDPFNGKKDLEDAVIRFTKDPEKRIKEDPIRMIRACRFAALIQGSFSLSSFEVILACKDLLDTKIAKERILGEIYKAMGLKRPSLFFAALKKTGLLSKIFPSLDCCHGLDGGPHHGETVFEHCMMVGDALSKKRPVLRLAGFLHDVGKFDAAKISQGKISFKGHENDIKAVTFDLEALRFSVKDIDYITCLIKTHMRPLTEQTSPKAARRLLSKLAACHLDYQGFLRMRIADKKGNLAKPPYTLSQIKTRLTKLQVEIKGSSVFKIDHLAITGNDIIKILGLTPGPLVGKIKQQLFEAVLDDPKVNTYDELKNICRSLQIKKE